MCFQGDSKRHRKIQVQVLTSGSRIETLDRQQIRTKSYDRNSIGIPGVSVLRSVWCIPCEHFRESFRLASKDADVGVRTYQRRTNNCLNNIGTMWVTCGSRASAASKRSRKVGTRAVRKHGDTCQHTCKVNHISTYRHDYCTFNNINVLERSFSILK